MLNQRANAQQSRKVDEEAWKKYKKERDLALKREEAAKNLSHLIAYQKDKRVRELKERQKQKEAENVVLGKSVKRLKGDLKDTVKGRTKLEQRLRQELKALREQNKKLQKELVVLKEEAPKSKKSKTSGEKVEESARFYSTYVSEDDEKEFETENDSGQPNWTLDSKLRKVERGKKPDKRVPKDTNKNTSTKQARETKKERKQEKGDVKRATSAKKKPRKQSAKTQRVTSGSRENAKTRNKPKSREDVERRRLTKKNRARRTTKHSTEDFDSYSDEHFEDTENEGEASFNRQNVREKKSRPYVNNAEKGQTEGNVERTKERGNKGALREKTDGTGGDRETKGGDRKGRGQDVVKGAELSKSPTRRSKRETNAASMVDDGGTSDSLANNTGDRKVGKGKAAGKTRRRGGHEDEAVMTSDSELEENGESARRKRRDRGKGVRPTGGAANEATEDSNEQEEYGKGRGNRKTGEVSHREKHKRNQQVLDSSSSAESDTEQHRGQVGGKNRKHNITDNGRNLPQITVTDDKNTVSLTSKDKHSKKTSTKAPTFDFRNEEPEESGEEGEGRKRVSKHKSRDGHVAKLRDPHVTNSHDDYIRGAGDHHTSYGKTYDPEDSNYAPMLSHSYQRREKQFAEDGDLELHMNREKMWKKWKKSEWENFLSENADQVSGVKALSYRPNRPGVVMATHGKSFPMGNPPGNNTTRNYGNDHLGYSHPQRKSHYNGISVPGDKLVFPTSPRKNGSRNTDDYISEEISERDAMESFMGSPIDVDAKIRQYRERADRVDVQLRRNQRVGMFAVQPHGKTLKERRVYPTTRILFRTYRNPGQPRATL